MDPSAVYSKVILQRQVRMSNTQIDKQTSPTTITVHTFAHILLVVSTGSSLPMFCFHAIGGASMSLQQSSQRGNKHGNGKFCS
jgi:hypothetical protein